MSEKRISEKDLVLPTLLLMEMKGGQISTSDLRSELANIFNPTGVDAQILRGRNDTHFDQKVRNLKSHSTLDGPGYATYSKDIGRGGFEITAKGREFLRSNINAVRYIMSNNFEWNDLKASLNKLMERPNDFEAFDEEIVIYEGAMTMRETPLYQRSKFLRDRAVEYYRDISEGELICEICNFNYKDRYGEAGNGYIEIHHRRPVYMYKGDDLNKTVDEAIKNLAPLCANCHRIVHRKRPPYSLDEVRSFLI